MNVSNAAYHKPLTINTPSLQKEGYDPKTGEGDDFWYAPTEKVMPRVYHKYLKANDLEHIYGPAEDSEEEKPNEQPDQPIVDPEPEPAPVEPEPEPEPENP